MIILKIVSDTRKLKRKNKIRKEQVILEKYLPAGSVEIVLNWLDEYGFNLKITRSRSTKAGDYMHPHNGRTHHITINNDLNKYSFLIILTHEVAHLLVWNKFRNKVLPHGREWKNEFSELLKIFFSMNIFPEDVVECLNKFSMNPKAAGCTDLRLARVLKKYDNDSETVHLEDLPENSAFTIRNGKIFIKGPLRRKRFLCTEVSTKRKYLVSSVAEVFPASLF